MVQKTEKLISAAIKAEAFRLGFSACGIAPAEEVAADHATRFTRWLQNGSQADMSYLEKNYEKRIHPQLLEEGTQSIVCVALNYYPKVMRPSEQGTIAWYAYGQDYHEVMKNKLRSLMQFIQEYSAHQNMDIAGRGFCDTAPVLERYWAWRAGLGWIGKNRQLILPKKGSTFFLGELFLNKKADIYDQPLNYHCGNCHRCLDACPTQALTEQGLDARRCLSYLTIENRHDIPEWAASHMSPCFYGCDRCQQACPHNKQAEPTSEEAFSPRREFLDMTWDAWLHLTPEQYRFLFKGSAVKRAKYEGLVRNIQAMNNYCKSHPQADKDPETCLFADRNPSDEGYEKTDQERMKGHK